MFILDDPNDGRFARLHGNAVGENTGRTHLIDDCSGIIFEPGGAAPGNQDDVIPPQGFLNHVSEIFPGIPKKRHRSHLTPQTGHQSGQGIRIDISNLPWSRFFHDAHHLVPGGDDGYNRTAENGHKGMAHGSQQPHIPIADPMALSVEDLVFTEIVSLSHDSGSGSHGTVDGQIMFIHFFHIFDHDHGICSPGNHAPGGYIYGLARLYQVGRCLAHIYFPDEFQQGRGGFGNPEGLGGFKRIPVHHRPVCFGNIGRGHQVFCQISAYGLKQGNFFHSSAHTGKIGMQFFLYLLNGIDFQ